MECSKVDNKEYNFFFFFQEEDGIRDKATRLEFRRVLFRSIDFLDASDHKTDFTRLELASIEPLWCENPDMIDLVFTFGRHDFDLVFLTQCAIHHPHQRHHTNIAVKP